MKQNVNNDVMSTCYVVSGHRSRVVSSDDVIKLDITIHHHLHQPSHTHHQLSQHVLPLVNGMSFGTQRSNVEVTSVTLRLTQSGDGLAVLCAGAQ